jgi:hypothetical protein
MATTPAAPPPFDWPDFLTLADELAKRTEESCLRTAISRAYYYAYHLGRQRIIDNEFQIVPGGDSHKQVWEKFEGSPDWECKKLALLAGLLKDKRQRADYDKVFPRIVDEFPTVLDMARKFATDLGRLNSRLPVNRGVRP